MKLRAVDDFTRSGVNAYTRATEKLVCDSLDDFFELLRTMSLLTKATIARQVGYYLRSRHVLSGRNRDVEG